MTKFEEEFDEKVEIFNVIGNHNSMCCEVDQVKEVFKDWQPQQALPVVPECVDKFITKLKKANNNLTFAFNSKFDEFPDDYWNEAIVWQLDYPEEFALAFITGKYEVEKPQLFYIEFPKVSKHDSYPWVDEIENGIIIDFTDKKSTALKLTEQEIKSIDERYWQFAVPVEEKK